MDNSVLFQASFDPWLGCRQHTPGCANCYLADMIDPAYWNTNVRGDTDWGVLAEIEDKPPGRLLVGDKCDVFEPLHSLDGLRESLWGYLESSQWTWVISTRYPECVNRLVPPKWLRFGWPENVWILVSVENELAASDRLPYLLDIKAHVRGARLQPLLWPVNIFGYLSMVDWVVLGAETGPSARPIDISWAAQTARDCKNIEVPIWIECLGANPYAVQRKGLLTPEYGRVTTINYMEPDGSDWSEWPEELQIRMLPGEVWKGDAVIY